MDPSKMFAQALEVVQNPKGFFSKLPREGGYEQPGSFAAALLVLYGVAGSLAAVLGVGAGWGLLTLFVLPIFGAIGIALGAALSLGFAKMLGADANFESSFRLVAFASVLMPVQGLLGGFPLLAMAASAYSMYLWIHGMIQVNRVPESKAWPILGGICALLVLMQLLMLAGAKQLEDHAGEYEGVATEWSKAAVEVQKAAEATAEKMRLEAEKTRRELESRQP